MKYCSEDRENHTVMSERLEIRIFLGVPVFTLFREGLSWQLQISLVGGSQCCQFSNPQEWRAQGDY